MFMYFFLTFNFVMYKICTTTFKGFKGKEGQERLSGFIESKQIRVRQVGGRVVQNVIR